MSEGKLRAATIGCGRMGATSSPVVLEKTPKFWMPLTHLGAISELPQLDAVACCDVSEESRVQASQLFNVPKHYECYSDLLASEDIDVLTIATRTPEKPAIISGAVKAGVKAIHVEKPLCNSVFELLELERLISQSNTLFTYGCIRRFLSPYLHARDIVRAHEVGLVWDIHVEMGNSSLMWTHTHALEMLLFFADGAAPATVSATFDNLKFSNDEPATIVNDPHILSATVIFDSGLVGRIGRTGGDAITVSGDRFLLQIFADGRETYFSSVPEGDLYMERKQLATENPKQPGGTAAALFQLSKAALGSRGAKVIVGEAKEAMLNAQHLMFDMLHSHINGGKLVQSKSHPIDMKILGLTAGKPA